MIKRIIIRTICLMMSTILMIGVCGCMKKSNLSVDACLNYMKSKYGEEFTYIEPYDESQPTSKTLKIFVESERFPGAKILVIEENVENNIVWHDNYVAVKYEEDVAELFNAIATDVYGECRILYFVDDFFYLSDSFDNETSFTEYTSKQSSNISVSVLLPPDHDYAQKEQELQLVYQKLCENSMVCTVNVFYVNNQDKYNALESSEDMMLESGWYDAKGQLIIDDDYSIESEIWR